MQLGGGEWGETGNLSWPENVWIFNLGVDFRHF